MVYTTGREQVPCSLLIEAEALNLLEGVTLEVLRHAPVEQPQQKHILGGKSAPSSKAS